MRGFAILPLIIILVIICISGAGLYAYSANQTAEVIVASPSPSSTDSPTPSPTSTQTATTTPVPISTISLVNCVGPDGKTVRLTQKACDDFKKSWATPTPAATSKPTQTSTQSSGCNTSTDLGNLTVNIQPQSGQSLAGDAAVTMSNGSGDCAGQDSRLPYVQVIRQGSTSITFSSYRPGKFHVQVGYHGNNYDSDATINPGDNSVTITVSN